jgi:hypothetical protein
MTKEEFDIMKREPSPAATPPDPRSEVLQIITPHLPRAAEILVRAVQNGAVQAAMALIELWRWARERSP